MEASTVSEKQLRKRNDWIGQFYYSSVQHYLFTTAVDSNGRKCNKI